MGAAVVTGIVVVCDMFLDAGWRVHGIQKGVQSNQQGPPWTVELRVTYLIYLFMNIIYITYILPI